MGLLTVRTLNVTDNLASHKTFWCEPGFDAGLQ